MKQQQKQTDLTGVQGSWEEEFQEMRLEKQGQPRNQRSYIHRKENLKQKNTWSKSEREFWQKIGRPKLGQMSNAGLLQSSKS